MKISVLQNREPTIADCDHIDIIESILLLFINSLEGHQRLPSRSEWNKRLINLPEMKEMMFPYNTFFSNTVVANPVSDKPRPEIESTHILDFVAQGSASFGLCSF